MREFSSSPPGRDAPAVNDELGRDLLDVRDTNAPLRDRLLKAMADANAWMTLGGIAGQLGMTPESIDGELRKLVDEKVVRYLAQGARGLFKVAQSSTPAPEDQPEPEHRGNPGQRSTKAQPAAIAAQASPPPKSPESSHMPTKKTESQSHGETLLKLIASLKASPKTVKQLADDVGCEQHTPGYHLKKLEALGKIERVEKDNRLSAWRWVGGNESSLPKAPPPAKAAAIKRSKPQAAPQRTPATPAANGCNFALWDDGRIVIVQGEEPVDDRKRGTVVLSSIDVGRLQAFILKSDALGVRE